MTPVLQALGGRYFRYFAPIFMTIVLLHFAEHVAQIIQLYVLHWPRPQSMGLLGLQYPWLMKSEGLHYAHALFMLLGIYCLQMSPWGGRWWQLALVLAFYHHFEHAQLFLQALMGDNFWDCARPCTAAEHILPRIELHLGYNLMVLIPMLVAQSRNPH